MNLEITQRLRGAKLEEWKALLNKTGLIFEGEVGETVLIWDGETLAAAGSRQGYLLKYIAVDPAYRGEDLTAAVLSALRTEAFKEGYDHLFLYTKPENREIFSSLFFYPIASTDSVLLMENRRDGIGNFIASLPSVNKDGRVGAIVMNCNPFTLGHQYLIERAANECDHVCVFVLSEEKSTFSATDRIEMVRLGTKHIPNVTVMPTGNYLVSAATFPTYFLKDREGADEVQCLLDIEIFGRFFAPHFNITTRYVGSEPLSPTTAKYNLALSRELSKYGVALVEVERIEREGALISASLVRDLIKRGEKEALADLLPVTTIEYLKNRNWI